MNPLLPHEGESTIDDIIRRRRQVVDKFYDFKSSIQSKKLLLASTKQFMQYKRVVDELMIWISEKLLLVRETCNPDVEDNSIKMQKLQVLEAEINAHKEVKLRISKICDEMKSENHYAIDQALVLFEKVQTNYNELIDVCKQCSKFLSLQLDNEDISRNIDDINNIVFKKIEEAQSNFVGTNLEEAKLLSTNFKAFVQTLIPERSRYDALVKQTECLLTSNLPAFETISAKLDYVSTAWKKLDNALSERQTRLDAAHEVYGFINESNETQSWIAEKEIAVSIEDDAKDLASSEALLRHHNLLERDLIAIEERVKLLEIESTKLKTQHVSYSDMLAEAQADLIRHWEWLRRRTEERGVKLSFSQRLQKFFRETSDILAWISDIKQLIQQDVEPDSVLDAEALIERLQDYDGDLAVRETNITSTIQFGNSILSSNQGNCEQVQATVNEIDSNLADLKEILVERRNHLHEKLEVLHFFRHCLRIKISFSKLSQNIDVNNTGNSWEESDGLLKELENIDHTFRAYCEGFNHLNLEANRLLRGSLCVIQIKTDMQSLDILKDQVELQICNYQKILLKIQNLHEFARQLVETREWVKEKLLELKQDHSNDLERALQLLLTIENDIELNSERIIDSINRAKMNEIPSGFSHDDFNELIFELKCEWDELQIECEGKRKLLNDKIDFSNFETEVEKLKSVLNGIEKQFNSLTFGVDLSIPSALKKSLHLLGNDIDSQKQRLVNLRLSLRKYESEKNENFSLMQRQTLDISERLDIFSALYSEKFSKIEEYAIAHNVLLEIDDELEWIKEKSALIQSCQITKNLISAQKMYKHFELLIADFYIHEKNIVNFSEKNHHIFSLKDSAESFVSSNLLTNWAELKKLKEIKQNMLLENITIQNYLSKSSDAISWLKEKEKFFTNAPYGKDEESVSLLLSQQVALLSDFEYFASTISELKLLSDSINLTLVECFPISGSVLNEFVKCKFNYVARRPQELSMEKGQIGFLLNSSNKDWWKIELSLDKTVGFVPANYLEFTDSPTQSNTLILNSIDPSTKQKKLELMYDDVLSQCQNRQNLLKEYQFRFSLTREINELLLWIHGAHAMASAMDDIPFDLESAESLKCRFEEFLTQVWSVESRIIRVAEIKDSKYGNDLNKDISILLIEWDHLLGEMEQKKHKISNHLEIQSLYNDLEDISVWIKEIDVLVFNGSLGRDLNSVQLLLREHQMVENTSSAIQDSLERLSIKSDLIDQKHPSLSDSILVKKTKLNKAYTDFSQSLTMRSLQLENSHYYHRFLTEQRDLMSWVSSLIDLVSLGELSNEISGAEALLMRIQELKIEIDARETNISSVDIFGKELIEKEHYATPEITTRLNELEKSWTKLSSSCKFRENKVKECLELLFFLRDIDRNEIWISNRNSLVSNLNAELSIDEVQNLIRTLNDFDKNIKVQETKIIFLQEVANTFIQSRHYASAFIAEKIAQVLQDWNTLKSLLLVKREDVGKTYSFQQFTLDACEMAVWMSERKDIIIGKDFLNAPFNALQQLCQRHEALEAEVSGNEVKFRSIIYHGKQLVNSFRHHSQFDVISLRINTLEEDWNILLIAFEERRIDMNHSKEKFEFIRSAKALLNWIHDVIEQINSDEISLDTENAETHLDAQNFISVDINIRKDQLIELRQQSESLLAKCNIDTLISETIKKLQQRFEELEFLFSKFNRILKQRCKVIKHLRNLNQEDSWLTENILSASVKDYGKDLIGVQRLIKKQQRLDIELESRQCKIVSILNISREMLSQKEEVNLQLDLEVRSKLIEQHFQELREILSHRAILLVESEEYQNFSAKAIEEEIWLDEKLATMQSQESTETISEIHQLLCRLEAFSSDFTVHQRWIGELSKKGSSLIEVENLYTTEIQQRCTSLKCKLTNLESLSFASKERHNLSKLYVQFLHRLELVDYWINLKEIDVKLEDLGEGRDVSYIEALINKQHTLEISLQVFHHEGMIPLIKEKDSLITSCHLHSSAVQTRFSEIHLRFEHLKDLTNKWNIRLQRSLDHCNKVDELFLLFAKKASGFCSWFESSEEDLVEPIVCNSIDEVKILSDNFEQFKSSLSWAQSEIKQLQSLDRQIKSFTITVNPYTWHTNDSLQEIWNNLQSHLQKRQSDLNLEKTKQDKNDKLKRIFADKANSFSLWLVNIRRAIVECTGHLQTQIEFLQSKLDIVLRRKCDLLEIEQLAIDYKEGMMWHNAYTEHTPVSLNQQLEQILQLGRKMIHNVQQQILERSTTGVKEEDLKVFQTTFKYYDKDNSGQLEEMEFKSCLRSLGYSLSVLDEGQKDPEYERILDQVDPNRLGYITLNQFMSFMISRSTENVKSREELEDAFKAVTYDKNTSYVMEDELKQAVGNELKDFCIEFMKPISSSKPSALDYKMFTQKLFLP